MKLILSWILPPVIGAIIGYVTNVVAIRMLFRPLYEIRVFGIRLPFTPGILPKQRDKLAESIGRMVEQELLTPAVLRNRLASNEIREKLKGSFGTYTKQAFDRPLSDWLDDRMGDFPLSDLVSDFIDSEVFNAFLEEIIREWFLGSFSENDRDNDLGFWFKSRIRDFGSLFISPARHVIKSGISRGIKKPPDGELSIYRKALDVIIKKYPGITLGEFISLGEVKKQKLDVFLVNKAISSVDENIESVLSSVDVKTIVADRINSLDVLRVEKIILDIMADQFRWIDIFGGILGGLIGFVQVFISLFTDHFF